MRVIARGSCRRPSGAFPHCAPVIETWRWQARMAMQFCNGGLRQVTAVPCCHHGHVPWYYHIFTYCYRMRFWIPLMHLDAPIFARQYVSLSQATHSQICFLKWYVLVSPHSRGILNPLPQCMWSVQLPQWSRPELCRW